MIEYTYWLVFILVLPLGVVSCNHDHSLKQEETCPNIVLIIGDDHGYPYFGFMGADYVHTPHLDTLAEYGVLFTNGFVPANHCRPSLQTLITGQLPVDYNNRVESLLTSEKQKISFQTQQEIRQWERAFRHQAMQYFETLPKLLSRWGCRCFQGGKWWEFHHRNGGFEYGMTTGWTAGDRQAGGQWFKKFMGGDGLDLARLTMEPVYDFIDSNLEAPFFIWYAPELPHYPFDAPKKYYDFICRKGNEHIRQTLLCQLHLV